MKNTFGSPYGGCKEDVVNTAVTLDYIPSIIGGSGSDEDIPFALSNSDLEEDILLTPEECSASKIYTGVEEDEPYDSKLVDIIRGGIKEEFLRQLPQDKLEVIVSNAKSLKNLIEGVDLGCKVNGIEISKLVEIINDVEVDILDLFLSNAFNVLNFAHYNKSVSLVDLFKLSREFIILFVNNSYAFSNIIKDICLNDLVELGHEKVSYAISYFFYKDRNDLISFSTFMRLFEFNPKAIKDVFPVGRIRGNIYESPFVHSKKQALEKIKNMNIRSNEMEELLSKAHISDWFNLLLCEILFSKVSDLINAINRYPSSKYEERGMDYIIKLYEEQSQMPGATKDNKPDVNGKFCGILLFCQRNVISFLDKDLFSLDDMQAICNEYPDYLKEMLCNQRMILEWNRGKYRFYEDIGLENGDQFFADLKEKKPVLFVFYMKFKDNILEVLTERLMTLSDIEDMYLISIKCLEDFFKDKNLILKLRRGPDFYNAIGLEEGYAFFRNIEHRRMDLFFLVFKFQDEILCMHQDSIMSFQDMVYIYDNDPLILEAVLNNSHKIEWLMKDERYKSMDEVLKLFSTNGRNCLKNLDIIKGGFVSNPCISKSEIVMEWDEFYKKECDIKRKSEKNVSFNESMKVVLFDRRGAPNDLIPDASRNPQPEASTALPCINSERSSANLQVSIQKAINVNLPYITQRDAVGCNTAGLNR